MYFVTHQNYLNFRNLSFNNLNNMLEYKTTMFYVYVGANHLLISRSIYQTNIPNLSKLTIDL